MIKLGDRVKIKKLWEGDTKPYYKDIGIELKEGMKGTVVYIGGDKYPYKIEFEGIDIPLWISSKSELEKIGEKTIQDTFLNKLFKKLSPWH